MYEQLPYHPLEDYQPPSTAAERIYDELHYGGEGASLRQCWTNELGRMYENTNLFRSLSKLAVIGVTTHAEALSTGGDYSMKPAEIATKSSARCLGAVLAVRSILPTFDSKDKRFDILNFDIYQYGYANMNGAQIAGHLLNDFDLKNYLFDLMDDDLQMAVLVAAEKLYIDYPEQIVHQQEDDFIFGYTSAHYKINAVADQYG